VTSAKSEALSVTEYAVLGLLNEGPAHGFAIARELRADGEVGRLFTVRRPLVYRALDRLVATGCARPTTTEQGGGPTRQIHAVTPLGRRRLASWLREPVEHVRDLRIEFLLKMALLQRSGRSPLELIRRQRAALEATIDALEEEEEEVKTTSLDHVELWRRHNATAVRSYLEELEAIYAGPGSD
jgi:PadR family transcriptional regulator AphA